MSKSRWPEQQQMYADMMGLMGRFKTQREAAKRLGCSEVMLSEVLLGKRPISRRIARSIGYHKVVAWEKLAAKAANQQ